MKSTAPFSVVAILPLSCLAQECSTGSGGPGFSICPKVVKDASNVTVTLRDNPFRAAMIYTPKGQTFYLVTNDFESIPFKHFSMRQQFHLSAASLSGQTYVDGKPQIERVFDKPGTYTFYFADNVETEPANAISATVTVEYKPPAPDARH